MTTQTTPQKQNSNLLQRLITRIDRFQQRHRLLAIIYAVIKKYSDDQAGYQGALLAYYGFVSLFPLLIVATSIINLIAEDHPDLHQRLLQSITDYFPAIGNNLQSSVHVSGKTGVGLAVSLLITLYGARGIANALRHSMDHVWQVPYKKRLGFPRSLVRSLVLIMGSGTGLLLATFLSSYATVFGHSFLWRAAISLASLFILFWTFCFIFRFATSSTHKLHDNFPGAIVAAVGFQILQTFGGYLITHQLKNQNGLNAQFAVVLALLFWLYLLAQVFLYSAEINTVRTFRLWPRSITGKPATEGDRHALELYAKREAYHPRPEEEIEVRFNTSEK